jgi:hypothetical protein
VRQNGDRVELVESHTENAEIPVHTMGTIVNVWYLPVLRESVFLVKFDGYPTLQWVGGSEIRG